MKNILRIGMLLCSFLLASVGWAMAWAEEENQTNGVTITSDLSQALVNQETVYSVTTTKGTVAENTMVRVTVTPTGETELSNLTFWYYEPNRTNPVWKEWNPVDKGYGPSTGFPLIDGTSYFKVRPKTAGEYTYTMKVVTVVSESEQSQTLAEATCTVKAVETLTAPYASITTKGESATTVNYASIPDAMRFVEEGQTIDLSAGTFTLSTPLTITKAITIKGDDSKSVIEAVTNKENFTPITVDTKKDYNLVTIGGDGTGSVKLENLRITGSHGSGLNVQTPMTTQLSGVQLYGNANAGLLVHSVVVANQLETQNNGWGGVNIDKGSTNYNPQLTIESNGYNFKEKAKIWAEKANCSDPYATVIIKDQESNFTYKWAVVEGKGGEKWNTDMIYWVTTDRPKDDSYTTKFVSDYSTVKDSKGNSYYNANFYANGNPVQVVAMEEDEHYTKIVTGDYNSDFIVLPYQNRASLYGGAKDKEVNSTSVTMTGGQLARIFGGGYGSSMEQKADISGQALVFITGGSITDLLCGGGNQFAKTNTVNVTIAGQGTVEATYPKVQCLYAGGFSYPAQTSLQTSWNDVVCGAKTVSINISNAILEEGFGCGGGQGYAYTGFSNVNVQNAKLGAFYGTLANGYAETIFASLTDCEFKKFNNYYEMGVINRGTVNNAYFTFNNCTFEEGMSAGVGAIEGWDASDTTGDPKPFVLGNVSWTFNHGDTEGARYAPDFYLSPGLESANVTVTGAKVVARQFTQSTNPNVTAFTINAGKTWAFNSGLTIAKDVTLDKQGQLIIGVDTEEALQAAVALDADTIKLAAKDFALTKQLTMNKSVALVGTTDGGKTSTIKYSDNFKGGTDSNSKHMISVLANNVLLQNLVVDGTGYATGNNSGSAINVYKAKGVVLDNVVAKNTIAAGLIVNGSEVTATNFHTEGNGWYGVNVDQGKNVSETPKFTIGNNCSFAEATAIKADSESAASSWVVGDGWVMVSKTENKETFKIWQNAAAQGINYAIISVPATVVYGDENLPLLSNITAEEREIKFAVAAGSESVEIETVDGKQTLKIKKPGKATLSLEYDGVTVTQAVEVLKRTITVSGITAKDKTYDGTKTVELDNEATVIVSGTLDNEPINLGYDCELESADAGDAVPVKITATALNMTNFNEYYTVAVAPVTAKVSKAELTVTTKTIAEINYGTTPTGFDVDYTGFVNGETKEVLSGTLQFDCPATSSSLAGTYTVTPYGLTSNNYAITYVGTILKINAISPSVEIVSATVSNDKSTVTVKGHVTNNGGTKTTELTGGFQVGEDVKASDLKVDENGYFTADLTDLSKAEINLKATATATIPESQSLKGTSTTDFKVDLALNPQNVSFVTNLSRLVYGSKVTLDAAGYAKDAEVKFEVSEGGVLTLDETDGKTITATEPGTATITVTATKDGYITATAKQTVVVEPKTITYKPSTITKQYDGKLEVNVNCSLEGIVGNDDVQMDIDNVKYRFLDKNVGENKPVVISEPLKIKGSAKSCYTVIQPTNWTGSITSGGNVIITVSNVYRKYNESALHYSLNFTANGQPIKPIYTGSITVIENSDGTWTASLDNVNFPNYGKASLAPESGTVEIEKGTPKVLTHHDANGNVTGSVVDTEGWTDVTADGTGTDTNGTFAKFKYDGGLKSVRGVSLNPVGSLQDHNWQINEDTQNAQLLSARMLRAGSDVEQITFGQKKVLTRVMGFTYSVSNPAVVTLTEKDVNSYYINAVGVGDAAVIATHSGGTVVYKQIHVSPAELTISASNADKTYDGTTVANPSLTIEGTPAGVALNLEGISFNYASANAADNVAIHPTQPIALTGANAANYQVSTSNMTGKINARELTVTSPISKYYDGSATLTLTDYNATGLLVGEAAPAITVTFADAKVGTDKTLTWPTSLANSNYTLASGNPEKGNIVRSTIDAVLPASAPSADALKQRVTLTVRETGATVNWNTIGYNPTITTTGSGASTAYYISGGDTENYAVVYSSNQLGYRADPIIPGGGGGGSSEPETPETPTTPDTPTGIEAISEGSQLYTVRGTIVVAPAEPLQVAIYSVTGQTLFNDEVSYLTQVPAKAGIYVVVIQKGNDRITEKVFVK